MTTTQTPTTTYTHDDGSPFTEREARITDQVRDQLLSGETFRLHANSDASRYGYQPPIGRDAWAHAIQTLGRMAAESGAFAQLASQIVGRLNLYGTAGQLSAKVWDLAEAALAAGYDDVLGRTGPEAGRPSSYHRDYTLAERIELVYWLTEATALVANGLPSVGWCVAQLAKVENVRLPKAVRRFVG